MRRLDSSGHQRKKLDGKTISSPRILEESGPKTQTSGCKINNTRDVMYSVMTVSNAAV